MLRARLAADSGAATRASVTGALTALASLRLIEPAIVDELLRASQASPDPVRRVARRATRAGAAVAAAKPDQASLTAPQRPASALGGARRDVLVVDAPLGRWRLLLLQVYEDAVIVELQGPRETRPADTALTDSDGTAYVDHGGTAQALSSQRVHVALFFAGAPRSGTTLTIRVGADSVAVVAPR